MSRDVDEAVGNLVSVVLTHEGDGRVEFPGTVHERVWRDGEDPLAWFRTLI